MNSEFMNNFNLRPIILEYKLLKYNHDLIDNELSNWVHSDSEYIEKRLESEKNNLEIKSTE